MKRMNNFVMLPVILMGMFIMLTSSCEDEKSITYPTVSTNAVSNITQTTATCGGSITNDGGGIIKARGVCWNTNIYSVPTIANSKTSDGTGAGSFTSNITGLSPNTSYFVCAYATNGAGTSYGAEVLFTTLP